MGEPAFSGLRVFDCTEGIAGSYCTKLFANFGAKVIKVERPGERNAARKMASFLQDEPHPEKSGTFFYLNTNKKSITLNLRTDTWMKIFRKPAREADVLKVDFEPGTMSEIGLSFEILKEMNSSLIMTSIDFN